MCGSSYRSLRVPGSFVLNSTLEVESTLVCVVQEDFAALRSFEV